MACALVSSSFPTAFQNDNKQWDVTDNSARPIPYGRFNGLLNTKIGGRSSPCRSRARHSSSRASGILSNPVTLPLDRISPACDGNLLAGAQSGCRQLFYSSTLGGWRRLGLQALPNQHISQTLADRLEVHPYRLSSSRSSRWIDPNENGLTHATQSLSPDDKSHD
jgi:hypothetical protein